MGKTRLTGGPGDKAAPKPNSGGSLVEQLKQIKKTKHGKVLPHGANRKFKSRVKINKKR